MSITSERIKERRIKSGLNVDDLAKLIGKNRATIYRYESDFIEDIPSKALNKLAEVLNTTPQYLLGTSNDPNPKPEVAKSSYSEHIQRINNKLVLLDTNKLNIIESIIDSYLEKKEE